MKQKLPFFSLVILIIASIDNIRNLPAAAIFGSSLIFFFIFAAIVFLIPTALVSAELSATFPQKGGVYHWVDRAFGKKWAMTAIWLQWINTMVWFPSILLFISGTFAYLFNPELAQNKIYLISCILIIFWSLTLINLRGIHTSALFTNWCAIFGTIIPMIGLIILGIVWVATGQTQNIHFTSSNIIPSFSQSTNWISLIAIMASFLGMELSGVHVNDIKNPQRNFPRAVFIASTFIFLSLLLGSLSIAMALPEKDINLVAGVMQVFSNFFELFGLKPLIPVLTLLITIGSTGTMINWLISPAKGLLHASEFGFLPSFFSHKNKAGVASRILITQALLVSFFCLIFLMVPGVNAFYWFLTALSTELYMIMYLLMFGACIYLHHKYKDRPKAFKIPGNHWGMWTTTLLGLTGCLLTIVVSFFPPENIDVGTPIQYLWMISLGNIFTISPLLLFFLYKKLSKN